jgi:hypothetical protein
MAKQVLETLACSFIVTTAYTEDRCGSLEEFGGMQIVVKK